MQRTKIISTIGPASESPSVLRKMMIAGMDIARLNMSHNTHSHHLKLINNIRNVAKSLNRPVAIIQDLQGPKIRTGVITAPGFSVKKGDTVVMVPENMSITVKASFPYIYVPTQFKDLYKYVKINQTIYIDDAMVELKVLGKKGKIVECRAQNDAIIKTHKGINIPGANIKTSAITDKDLIDLEFGIKNRVDFVALSFVSSEKEILDLRKKIEILQKNLKLNLVDYKKPSQAGKWSKITTKIISKIERPQAVKNFDKILEASDAIMIARGDLGLEVPLEDLPMIQKDIIEKCLQASKPVIVATQMLNSMIENPFPTRAEVSDVANAILDGADATMLSGETAAGAYPIRAIKIMDRIAKEVELSEVKKVNEDNIFSDYTTTAMAANCKRLADKVGAKAIICTTTSGFAARSISRFKPRQPIIALTPSPLTEKQLNLSWGVFSYLFNEVKSFDKFMENMRKIVIKEKILKKGDKVVVMTSHPVGFFGPSNILKVDTI